MRFEVVMKGESDYRIFDNQTGLFCSITDGDDGLRSNSFSELEAAMVCAEAMNGNINDAGIL